MVKPYFQDDNVTLYLGDCREITEWLAADVLVTDPPYGRGSAGVDTSNRTVGRLYRGTDDNAPIAGDEDTGTRDTALGMWGSRPAMVFGDLRVHAGSTLVAARNLGRQAIGIELEERHCERTARRLSQMVLKL